MTVVGQRHDVAAHRVACRVGVEAVRLVAALADEGVPESLEVGGMAHFGVAAARTVVRRTAELRGHLQAELVGQRELVGAPYVPVECFLVVEDVTRVAPRSVVPFLLPLAVGHHAVAAIETPLPPAAGAGQRKPVDVQPHLRDGTCVGAQAEATARQLDVLRLQGLLLGTEREAELAVTPFHVGLLHHQMARVAEGDGGVHAVADAPTTGGIVLDEALCAHAFIY